MPTTLALFPWHVHSNKDGSASIRDAHNEVLAVFTSHREADYVLSLFDKVKEQDERIDTLEIDNENLTAKLDNCTTPLKNKIEDLEFIVTNLNQEKEADKNTIIFLRKLAYSL